MICTNHPTPSDGRSRTFVCRRVSDKSGSTSKHFPEKVAAEMRNAGAALEVTQPVLAAKQEAHQRQSEAKALAKLATTRNAAGQV